MKSANQTQPKKSGRPFIQWCVGGSALVYVLTLFVPCRPPVAGGELDWSWMQILHRAFEQHLQSGRDIVFTFGPWGFLYGGYAPATHALSVLVWVALSLVFWWSAWQLARQFTSHEFFRWLWLMGFAGVAGLTITQNIDARLLAWSILLLGLHFFGEDRPSGPTQILLVVSLGLISLIKFTCLLMAVLVVAVIAADTIIRRKRFPAIALWYAGGVLLFWLAAGQRLNSLPPYLINSWRITNGFTEAMLFNQPDEARAAALFGLVATPLLLLFGYMAWARHRWFGLPPGCAFAGLVFVVFKYGHVRHDVHMIPAALELLLLAWVCVPLAWPVLQKHGQWLRLAALVPAVAALLFAASTVGQYHPDSLLLQASRTFRFENVVTLLRWSRQAESLRAAFATESEQTRNRYRLPPAAGDVDLYPYNQAVIFASALPYRPRPVIQSYSAYTPELASLNALHLRSDRAAKKILFEVRTIDDRFPSLDDGLSWPELLTRYDIRDAIGPFLLLTRTGEPRAHHLTPLQDILLRFAEPVAVPSMLEGPIWARLEIEPSGVGRIVSAAFKPTMLQLDVTLRNGMHRTFRLVPGQARAGFLLSPVILDYTSFAILASRDWQRNLADFELVSLTIRAATESGTTAHYQSPMRLVLQRLEFPRQDLSGIPGMRALHNLHEAIRRATLLHAEFAPEVIGLSQGGTVLAVSPNSQLQLTVEGQPSRLTLGFGWVEPQDTARPDVPPIEFRAIAVDDAGRQTPLWSQRLTRGEKGTQRAVLNLPHPTPKHVILQTLSSPAVPGGFPYWSAMDFE